mgnify:CR=1 FL=1
MAATTDAAAHLAGAENVRDGKAASVPDGGDARTARRPLARLDQRPAAAATATPAAGCGGDDEVDDDEVTCHVDGIAGSSPPPIAAVDEALEAAEAELAAALVAARREAAAAVAARDARFELATSTAAAVLASPLAPALVRQCTDGSMVSADDADAFFYAGGVPVATLLAGAAESPLPSLDATMMLDVEQWVAAAAARDDGAV